MRRRDGGRAIGYVQATVGDGEAAIAWTVGTAFQRQGFATEAGHALIAWLRDTLGVPTIVGSVHPDNIASQTAIASDRPAPDRSPSRGRGCLGARPSGLGACHSHRSAERPLPSGDDVGSRTTRHMKDAPLLRGNLAVRLVSLFGGLIVFGLAIVSMLESRLGLPPWDVLHLGIAKHTPLSLGETVILVGSIIVAIAWVAGTRPGFGTIANATVIGIAIDVLSSFDAIERLSDSALPVRIFLLAAGVLLFGVGSTLYIGAGMGAGPRDSLMLMLSRRTGRRIGLVRGTMEVTVLAVGVLLGGVAGVGTVTLAILVGPVVELCFWTVLKLGLATPRPMEAMEFGPLDAA